MTRPQSTPSGLLLVGLVVITAAGNASNLVLDSPYRLLPAFLLVTVGIAGIANAARDYSVDRLLLATKRWWAMAFVTFLPYALATAPESDSAAAVGAAFDGPFVSLALQSIAGAMIYCAVAMTVLYGFARYGIHPGRSSPEERILADGDE